MVVLGFDIVNVLVLGADFFMFLVIIVYGIVWFDNEGTELWCYVGED